MGMLRSYDRIGRAVTSFICNICGAHCAVEKFATEPASCSCGSNVRMRALIHLLSLEIFGQSLILADFPKLKAIRGLGMSDQQCYAGLLAEKFDYTNTYYDRDPRFDFTESHPKLSETYDFILSADVFEHIAPPVERACEEVQRLLKPRGFLALTVYCNPTDRMREHFPSLNEFRIVPLRDSAVLINRKRDGKLELFDNLVFHGGQGATLEMREFSITELQSKLLAAGFRKVDFLTDNLPEIGILFDQDVSQLLVARKEPFAIDRCATSQMIGEWRTAIDRLSHEQQRAQAAEAQIRLAAQSKWLRLGRRLGLGPDLNSRA
jgi:SAM-dependent methyltransferase